ncbi:MAG: type II toxin-antitoxin system RatA family toxin [Armatimonadota bacterium]
MPTIIQNVLIAAPIETVYKIMKDVEQFPNIMADLESLVVLERSADASHTITKWVGLVREFNMKVGWTEDDTWDDAAHKLEFRQIEGDMTSMDGVWQLTEEAGATRFSSTLNYEYEVPLLGALVKKLIHKKLEQNVQMILDGVKAMAEKA